MQLTEFTLRLLLLFFPGIITKLILEYLTVYEEKRHFYFIIYSFVLGLLSYILYYILLAVINLRFTVGPEVYFLKALLDPKTSINYTEIVVVSGIAIIIGLFLSFIINNKYFYHVTQKFGITKKFAEIDVWGYLFNSDDDEMCWIRVRDHSNNLCYEGWVEAFSDTVKENELFIRKVKIFINDTGEELYEVPGLYISRNKENITIEFYAIENIES
ncbi:hypothetical protein ACFL5K_03605 [Gemmatimonadota bacterium]